MDNRPIGVFDSGFGGLTAVRELIRLMPGENIVYYADSARVPYGSRPVWELRQMAVEALDFFRDYDAKAILVACGTISSNAGDILAGYDIPSFGVIDPAVEAVGSGVVGVIATEASIRSGVFERKLKALAPDRPVVTAACPDFAPLIEAGHFTADDEAIVSAVEKYLAPIKAAGVSSLILGCTHYGLIAPLLADYLGEGVQLVSASECAARRLRDYIVQNGLTGGTGQRQYVTSGDPASFTRLAGVFLGDAWE